MLAFELGSSLVNSKQAVNMKYFTCHAMVKSD